MKLDVSWITNGRKKQPRRPPPRTVTEIAEMLGVTPRTLAMALRHQEAPKPTMRGREMGHLTGRNRVWYEPGAVLRWWRNRTDQ